MSAKIVTKYGARKVPTHELPSSTARPKVNEMIQKLQEQPTITPLANSPRRSARRASTIPATLHVKSIVETINSSHNFPQSSAAPAIPSPVAISYPPKTAISLGKRRRNESPEAVTMPAKKPAVRTMASKNTAKKWVVKTSTVATTSNVDMVPRAKRARTAGFEVKQVATTPQKSFSKPPKQNKKTATPAKIAVNTPVSVPALTLPTPTQKPSTRNSTFDKALENDTLASATKIQTSTVIATEIVNNESILAAATGILQEEVAENGSDSAVSSKKKSETPPRGLLSLVQSFNNRGTIESAEYSDSSEDVDFNVESESESESGSDFDETDEEEVKDRAIGPRRPVVNSWITALWQHVKFF